MYILSALAVDRRPLTLLPLSNTQARGARAGGLRAWSGLCIVVAVHRVHRGFPLHHDRTYLLPLPSPPVCSNM